MATARMNISSTGRQAASITLIIPLSLRDRFDYSRRLSCFGHIMRPNYSHSRRDGPTGTRQRTRDPRRCVATSTYLPDKGFSRSAQHNGPIPFCKARQRRKQLQIMIRVFGKAYSRVQNDLLWLNTFNSEAFEPFAKKIIHLADHVPIFGLALHRLWRSFHMHQHVTGAGLGDQAPHGWILSVSCNVIHYDSPGI